MTAAILSEYPSQLEVCRALVRDAPLLNLDDARFALDEAARVCDEYLRSEAVLRLIPGASASDDGDELARRLSAAAQKDSAAARAWRRLQHLDLPRENWQGVITILEEDQGRLR